MGHILYTPEDVRNLLIMATGIVVLDDAILIDMINHIESQMKERKVRKHIDTVDRSMLVGIVSRKLTKMHYPLGGDTRRYKHRFALRLFNAIENNDKFEHKYSLKEVLKDFEVI